MRQETSILLAVIDESKPQKEIRVQLIKSSTCLWRRVAVAGENSLQTQIHKSPLSQIDDAAVSELSSY